jgi:dienelactone hydrolase
MRLLAIVIFVTVFQVGTIGQTPAAGALDKAFRAFWSADSPDLAAEASMQILATGAGFDQIAARLKAGRDYVSRRTGRIALPSRVRGVPLDNVLEVPAGYNPGRAWPLRVMLHGGVSREPPEAGDEPARPLTNRLPGDDELVLHPRAFARSEWWTNDQVDNINRLLMRVRREHNVDESRVYVTGFSDGGTGAYYLAMRDATPWAACIPLHGHPLVLANPQTGVEGELFAGNLVNCPLRVVNGGRDQLYPAASVVPFIEMFRRGGIPVDFQAYPDAEHNTRHWPEERPRFEAFLAAHRRVAHPERISWETDRTDRDNRFRWLVIDRLGTRSSDVDVPDVNRVQSSPGRERELFARSRPSGRVDVVRRGNAFEAKTRGVRGFTLLLSPDVLDFARPVRVTVNGRVVVDKVVTKDAATLLAWAARDQDRTMLYGAELRIVVP